MHKVLIYILLISALACTEKVYIEDSLNDNGITLSIKDVDNTFYIAETTPTFKLYENYYESKISLNSDSNGYHLYIKRYSTNIQSFCELNVFLDAEYNLLGGRINCDIYLPSGDKDYIRVMKTYVGFRNDSDHFEYNPENGVLKLSVSNIPYTSDEVVITGINVDVQVFNITYNELKF